MLLLANRDLPLGLKDRLYFVCLCSFMLCETWKSWPVQKEDVIRLEWNDAGMVRWIKILHRRIGFLLRNLGLN